MEDPCREIVLGSPQVCNLGHLCTSCEIYITGHPDGICGRCLHQAEFNALTNHGSVVVGYLIGTTFYCNYCASWFDDQDQHPMLLTAFRGYSQICTLCRKVVVWGKLPFNLYDSPWNKSRRVLGV